MADITRLARFLNGAVRGIDLTSNTLVVSSIKLGAGQTELTETILGRLISLQNGTDVDATYHTHDGRYFTETELGAITDSASGADKIGATAVRTQVTVQSALEKLDTDLGTAEGKIDDLVTLSGVAANAESLGTFTGATIPDSSTIKGALQAIETAYETTDGKVVDLVTLSGVAANAESLGTFTGAVIPDSQTIKQAFQALETYSENLSSLINNFEWQESVKDQLDTPPGSPASGDRYLVIATATGAWAGQENKIAEYNGTSWDFTAPSTGMYVAIDDENDGLYLYGGASWAKKYFEATTASTGLTKVGFDVRLANASAANGISVSSGAISAVVDNSTIEIASTALAVKADGINGSHIRLANNQFLKARNAADDANVNMFKVNASDKIEMASFMLTPSSAPTADYEVANKKYVDDAVASKDDASEITFTPTTLADWTGSADPGNVDDALDQLASRAKALESQPTASIVEAFDAGEAFASGSIFAVRMAMAADAGFVAGRVYKADKDASSADNFHVVGLVLLVSSASAGDSISVTKMGKLTATAHGFTTIGAPLFLSASGALTQTAPSAINEAVMQVGIVRDANTIEVQIKEKGVN